MVKIKSDKILGVNPQSFRKDGRKHSQVRIYLTSEPNNTDLEKIQSVQYILHPTFKDRNRFSTDRFRQFEVTIWTYGFFKVEAILTLNNGKQLRLGGFVRW